MDSNIIEKAKWNIGDEKTDKHGNVWVVGGFNAKGIPLWRSKDKSGDAKTSKTDNGTTKKTDEPKKSAPSASKTLDVKDIKSLTPEKLAEYAKNTPSDKLAKVVNDKTADKSLRQIAFNELKGRSDYDKTKVDSSDLAGGYVAAPTAKIQYKTKKPEVELPELKDYTISSAQGTKNVHIADLRKMMAGWSDDKLLENLNNRQSNYQRRQVAYEEAASRGIDEDKIDVNGTLLSYWRKEKDKKQIKEDMQSNYNEDSAVELSWNALPSNHAEIMATIFENGDDSSWMDKNSRGVKKAFQLDTKSGRKAYDAFKDYYQRQPEYCPAYLNAENKVNNLAGDLLNWAEAETSPMFISAGGAGAGKTYTWQKKIAPYLNLPQLQPGDNPEDTDWGYVMLKDNEILDEKNFRKVLATYNGGYTDDNGDIKPHILFFDDADKMLMTGSEPYKNLLKAIADSDPKNRIFTNPKTGQKELWKGKIIITTNKDTSELAGNKDFQAIKSRVSVNDIQFTKNETKEILVSNNRYMRMELPGTAAKVAEKQKWTKDEKKQFRQDVLDYLFENMDMADPNNITPRIYSELMNKIAPSWKTGTNIVDVGNGVAGTNLHWRVTALELLKANVNTIEKANVEDYYSKDAMIERKAELEKMMSDAKYKKIFSEDTILDFLSGDEQTEEQTNEKPKKKKKSKKSTKANGEVKKSFNDEMSLDEAEQILFS